MKTLCALALSFATLSSPAFANGIATANLQILGSSLEVVAPANEVQVNVPSFVQTRFGGKQEDEVPTLPAELAVAGDLVGPGISTPIELRTLPGRKFQIPALSAEGDYYLQNIRLVRGTDFLQFATPAFVRIEARNIFRTEVEVRQLTAEELRARGITIDERNFEVFEYTFIFALEDGKEVRIPFPVVIDKRTREVLPISQETPYFLPPERAQLPPRWGPPQTVMFDLGGGSLPDEQPQTPDRPRATYKPSIPAALVIPNDIAVLHSFFAVAIVVTNGAAEGSAVVLDEITATITTPPELRTSKTDPVVAFGQPVPIVGPNGVTALVAQIKGRAEYTLEALKSGTHKIEVFIRGTLRSPDQPDIPLSGKVSSAIVVHDPRFNITFSHPETVREGIEYSTFAFVTNTSPAIQTVVLKNEVPECPSVTGANICRVAGTPGTHTLADMRAGETRTIEYKFRSSKTGHVFASAGSASSDAVTPTVQLTLGVSLTGIPLSAATLVMPHYATNPDYLDPTFVARQLELLGLGYSLATAPISKATANFPRVVKTDVFQRAIDISRAGQRNFITNNRDRESAFANLALDLLGNDNPLAEWDQLRRTVDEPSGRRAADSLAREIEKASLSDGKTFDSFMSGFATATAHREPFAAILAHGAASSGPYRVAVKALSSGRKLSGANEDTLPLMRQIPWGELSRLRSATGLGELALIGRWAEDLEVTVTAEKDATVSIDVVYPGAGLQKLRARHNVTLAAGGSATFVIERGNPITFANVAVTPERVLLPDIAIVGARQDLYLDEKGHKVALLFNRPVKVSGELKEKFSATATLSQQIADLPAHFSGSRNRPIHGGALQPDGRVAVLNFDHALHRNAAYTLTPAAPLVDPTNEQAASLTATNIEIDNDRPAAVVTGFVEKADGSRIGGADVVLTVGGTKQYDTSTASRSATDFGGFFFEYVPIDLANGYSGSYSLKAISPDGKTTSVDGAVRLPSRAHHIVLQYLGRGRAEGVVRYENGEFVPNARVVVGSRTYNQMRSTRTDASGFYSVADLPVGPLTFSATDADGNTAYAANEIKAPGESLLQDLSIFRRPFPGTGTVRVRVIGTGNHGPIPNAHVGVYSQGYGINDGFTDSSGQFVFTKVPAGVVTVLAEEWTVASRSASAEIDLAAGGVIDVELMLELRNQDHLVRIEGNVRRVDAGAAGSVPVPGALVQIDGAPVITADANGRYVYEAIPISFGGREIRAYDPATKRIGRKQLRSFSTSDTTVEQPITIEVNETAGTGTIRVHVFDAAGRPAVSGVDVFEPGYPIRRLDPAPGMNGVYQLPAVHVGNQLEIWATYGEQWVSGRARVEFDGHVANLILRLPGEGTVTADILLGGQQQNGTVKISYRVFHQGEQNLVRLEKTADTTTSSAARFEKVPVSGTITLETLNHPGGYAKATTALRHDGDVRSASLVLQQLATIRGVVYDYDEVTPVPGATVRLNDGVTDRGGSPAAIDGSFEFQGVVPGRFFRVIAEIERDGIYRIGSATGRVPSNGDPVENVAVVFQQRTDVKGRVVRADNTPVPRAKFWLREVDFPRRSFGSESEPLEAGEDGQFLIPNIFDGAIRITARDPLNEFVRGDWSGTITSEGELVDATVVIGSDGEGTVRVTVVDPNEANQPVVSAEVTLLKSGAAFDFATTDGDGVVEFAKVPVGRYDATVFSKALGRSGKNIAPFDVVKDGIAALEIPLLVSGEIDGTLTDPQKSAPNRVPGAHVTLTASGYATRATTNSSGLYRIDGVREGSFKLEARDPLSDRRARATGSVVPPGGLQTIHLELERTGTLNVTAYLPTDADSAGGLAPSVAVEVTQTEFRRGGQGNPISIPGLLRNRDYTVKVTELGGQGRVVRRTERFPDADSHAISVVFPAYGTVRVLVVEGSPGVPVPDAKVVVRRGSTSTTIYTDASGVATAHRIRLGDVSVQATSIDGLRTASEVGSLVSQTTPLEMTVTLASYATASGFVEAEAGGPSVGSRVVAKLSATRAFETVTDSAGRYAFAGIPNGTSLEFFYYGPDEITIGGRQLFTIPASGASHAVPPVKLDATRPLLVGFFPADGAANVSLDTEIKFVFSEPVAPISNATFQLKQLGGGSAVSSTFSTAAGEGNTFVVTMRPPALSSHTLYTVSVASSVADPTGNTMLSPRGFSFTTSDTTKPKIVKIEPSKATPIQAATAFRFTFSEPVVPSSLAPSSVAFFKVLGDGSTQSIAGNAYLDPANVVLSFAPAVAIEEQSRYRITISGLADAQGNAMTSETHEWLSFDTVKPVVALVSPALSTTLASGIAYDLLIATASDVVRVDYITLDANGVEKFLKSVTVAPLNTYRFTAPEVGTAGGTHAIKVIATDASGNASEPATFTWSVKRNDPPVISSFTLSDAGPVYAGKQITTRTQLLDEDLTVNVRVDLVVKKGETTTHTDFKEKIGFTRTSLDTAWPQQTFVFDLPKTLAGDEVATFTLSVTDKRQQTATSTATLSILPDTVAPQVTIVSPVADQQFDEGVGNTIPITVTAVDAEVDVKAVTASIEGGSVTTLSRKGTTNEYNGSLPVPSVTGPAIVARKLTVSSVDYASNAKSSDVSLRIKPFDDPSAPTAKWLCPSTPGALYPAGYNATLRVFALGSSNALNGVQKIEFFEGTAAVPFHVITTAESDNTYEVQRQIPAGVTTAAFRVVVTNTADQAAQAEATVAVVPGNVITMDTTIGATNTQYDNATLIVQSGTTTIVGVHRFDKLIVLDGASVTHIGSGTAADQQLTLDASAVFVSCNGAIDVSGKGFPAEATYPGEMPGTRGSGASHLGVGGRYDDSFGVAGSSYGSVKQPQELGGGGGTLTGRIGGGRVRIVATEIGLDGAVRANGNDAPSGGSQGAGAGGSIWITAARITGEGTIEANGGKPSIAAAGGGGAIAVEMTDPNSRGGWLTKLTANGRAQASVSGRSSGAGTIFIKDAALTHGSLTVDNGTITGRATLLPSFGSRTALSVNGDRVVVDGEKWVAPYFIGHEVEVTSPVNQVKGIVRVSGVDDGWNRSFDVEEYFLQETTAYDAYVIYSEETLSQRGFTVDAQLAANHVFVARFAAGQWQYDDNSSFRSFMSKPTDRIFMSFTKGSGTFSAVTKLTCASGVCGAINGIAIAEMVRGEIETNADDDSANPNEITLRGVLLTDGRSAAITFAPASAPVAIAPGDRLQGIYRFDQLNARNGASVASIDPIRLTTALLQGAATGEIELLDPIQADVATVTGRVSATGISAGMLTVAGDATLTHSAGNEKGLTIDVSGKLDLLGTIDVSGRGYAAETTYSGEMPGTRSSGASHSGVGGRYEGSFGAAGSAYGNVKRPQELGGGGGSTSGRPGAGRVRITAGEIVLTGSIRANGTNATSGTSQGAGAGGSIWISAGKITGEGIIEANGGTPATSGAGGGGTIAIETTDPASGGGWVGKVTALGRAHSSISGRSSGAGTIYTREAGATHGSLTIDNGAVTGRQTKLASFGLRTALAVAGNRVDVDGEKWIAPYLVGHEIEVSSASDEVKGIVRLSSVDNGSYTSIAGEQIYLQNGSSYDGFLIYSEETLSQRGFAVHLDLVNNHLFAARYANGQWQYDDNTIFRTFNPKPTDRVFMSFTKADTTFSAVTKLTCPNGVCGVINGMTVAEMVRGAFEPNADLSTANPDEITLRGVLLTDGKWPVVTFEPVAAPVAIAAGDKLRGLYQLDKLTLRNTNLVIADLLRATTIDQIGSTITATGENEASSASEAASSAVESDEQAEMLSISLASIAMSSAWARGGESVRASVQLNTPAPAGGAVILLLSDSTGVSIPATVLVPEGETTAAFVIETKPVEVPMEVTITGVYGATRSVSLGIQP